VYFKISVRKNLKLHGYLFTQNTGYSFKKIRGVYSLS